MRENTVKKQIQWILSYVQEESMDIQKENILENLESGNLEYEMVEEFLADLKKKFGGEDKEAVKVVKLKKLEQEERIMEELVQKFRKTTRGSKYKKKTISERI